VEQVGGKADEGELIEATWAEVDFENVTWIIPKQRMKGRNPHMA
jgi:hypothetical protein